MSLTNHISDWLRKQVKAADADGIVVGLSGGVDSACVAALAQQALGRKAVVGVLMPCHSEPIDAKYALLVAEAFELETLTIDLTPVYDTFIAALPPTDSRLTQANLKPRLRMTALYYVANSRNYLVAGTGNKSELLVGYFTKHGDGGADMLPLGDLYKREVYELARDLDVPQPLIDRPPTAGLWPGQTDEAEMGLTYDALERALVTLSSVDEHGLDRPTLPTSHLPRKRSGAGGTQAVDRVRRMVDASAHKRVLPPIFVRRANNECF